MPRIVNVTTQMPARRVGYGVVRDKNGRPKFDDIATAPAGVLAGLTIAEKKALGVWEGALARDAEGTKRLSSGAVGVYTAVDRLVALSEIFDGGRYYRLLDRVDVPAGDTITIKGA